MKKITVLMEGESMRLDQLLKIAGIAASGGQAGQLIKQGFVELNGQVIGEKRKKIFIDDKIIFDKEYFIELKA